MDRITISRRISGGIRRNGVVGMVEGGEGGEYRALGIVLGI